MKTWMLALALAAALPAHAADPSSEIAPRTEVLTENFLHYHPDLKFRMRGMASFEDGDHAEAHTAFKQSSRYADKASQAMVAEMLWNGLGTEANRALAYAWMDLAAERGYRNFVILREKYWLELDAAEREAAIAAGTAIYAEYGDEVAKPRLEAKLRQGMRQITGSRTGFTGALSIMVPSNGGWTTIDGSTYYADHYWRPDDYFDWQDTIWKDPPKGTVDVGPLQNLPPPPPGSEPTS